METVLKKNSAITRLFLNDRFILLLIIVNSFTIFGEGFHEFGKNILYYITLVDSLINHSFSY
jgi:hypothetical protein